LAINQTTTDIQQNEVYYFHKRTSCKEESFRVFTKVELLSRSEVSKKVWEGRRELAKV